LGIAALPAVLFLILLYGVPRSGRWLVTKGRVAEARSVLCQLGADHPDAELAEIVSSIHPEQSTEIEPLFQRKYRQPIILAMLLAAFNQLVGINAVMYYLNDIFLMAGFSRSSSGLQAVFIGLTNLIATLLAMSVIDKIGRKTLLLVGSVGMILSLSGVSFIFLTHRYEKNLLPLLIAYIFSFAISQGAVIWVFISEIFPNRVRAKGQSLGSSTHWVMNTLTAGVFPLFVAHSAGLPFVFFAAMAAVQFVMVFLIFPETKGVSLEELQKKLNIAF
jgi:sugar porter (SP) family MFS transporter